MLEASRIIKEQLQRLRTEEVFADIFKNAVDKAVQYDLLPLSIPRRKAPPQRYCGPSDHHHAGSPEEHYRAYFFSFLDSVLTQMDTRFNETKSGLHEYRQLEEMLLTGKVNESIVTQYPELQTASFASQLDMFKHSTKAATLYDAKQAYCKMSTDVRHLFPEVFVLIKLLLICPGSSCESERSFSALRRLKTWLRHSMTQHKLNYVSICHVHQEKLNDVNGLQLISEFVSYSDIRRNIYGST
jgi:hypothetical protein